jgi:hypothetical protein
MRIIGTGNEVAEKGSDGYVTCKKMGGKQFLFIFLPVALFLLISTVVLSLSFMDIKYTYEPALTGTAFDYLVNDTYSMAWLFYSVTNIAFAVIYLSALFVLYKLNRKRHM